MREFIGNALARRLFAVLALAVGLLTATVVAQPVQARVFVGVGLGGGPYWHGYGGGYGYPYPYYYGPGYYAPYYYPPAAVSPPVVYQQAPTVYQQPAPGYYQQAPQVYQQSPPPAGSDGKNCKPYEGNIVVDGVQQKTNGMACQSPDGSWHVVN